jgi:hypothetical protein
MNPKSRLAVKAIVSMLSLQDNVTVIPFLLCESLGNYNHVRLKKQLFVKNITLNNQSLQFAQEQRDSSVAVFLPTTLKAKKIDLVFEMEGDYMCQPSNVENIHYPVSTTDWYLRHGYLDRSTYNFTYIHPKKYKIA